MKSSIQQHKIIASLGFIVLVSVQSFLIYNTYKLKNDEFYTSEKNILKELYRTSIRNDKIFPGGQAIMDRYLIRNMVRLDSVYKISPDQFYTISRLVVDSMMQELKKANTIDALMEGYIREKNLDTTLVWASSLESLSLTFDGHHYIPIFQQTKESEGVLVNGGLKELNKQNEITSITVSAPVAQSYAASFALYADTPYRLLHILKSMTVPLLISFVAILGIMLIYYITFQNWIKQKKLAELKSDFVNSITHELHTPLSAIIVANKSLQNERIIEDREKILPLTAVIDRQSQRLKALFGQVLDLTVMNASSLQKEPTVFEELLEEQLLDYRLQLTNNHVLISYSNESGSSTVLLNKFWVTTMINNIIDNGIKYNNNRNKEINVHTKKSHNKLQLIISDNGIGIPDNIKRHIFEKFYRNTEGLTNKATNGLGLGLFYTRQCINVHNWELEIISNENSGSFFIIRIPIED
ncbi:MAG: HAMP domain-containing histidine kinase [Flavipsychrobacter sp.]|nr:HAMP domain-containing histidine kinase [Flavipsychrobacter sp.]